MTVRDDRDDAVRTCPKCGGTGDIEEFFGVRLTKTRRPDGTAVAARRPQSWCRKCRSSRPVGAARAQLAQRLRAILPGQLTIEAPLGGWPLLCEVRHGSVWLPAAIYIGQIGPSGRKNREGERRIQNPSKHHPIEPIAGRTPFLLGIDTQVGQAPVLVLWDAIARTGRATRYSAFLHVDDLDAARTDGLFNRMSANGERIIAFTPDRLTAALSLHIGEAAQMIDDDELDLEGLSATLASLSQGEVPSSFARSPSPFEPDDIDWSTNEWFSFVHEVQYWLGLDSDIDLSDGPDAAAHDLFTGLGCSEPSACYSARDGVVALTPIGFSRLDERASLAQSMKDAFDGDIADDFGTRQATRRWLARWEDEPEAPDLRSVDVHAKVDNWTIKWFKDLAEASPTRLELNPSYQRDVVWSNSDSQKLLDSVLRGIPLPSIILNQRQNRRVHEIVDGKQRLTAILRFNGCHPEGVRYAQERSTADASFSLFRDDYRRWRRLLGVRSAEERKHCLPFRLSNYKNDKLSHLSGRYFCEIKDEKVTIQGSDEALEDLFEGPSEYKIPVILYQNTDLQQIHRVFGLYNKQGKQLNAEELRNAIYHHLDLTKMLLVLGGDSSRPAELAPFATGLELNTVTETLHELQVGDYRFHRTKLTGWVAAILLHTPKRNDAGIKTPSTSGFINGLLEAVGDDPSHPMRDTGNLRNLASAMTTGAALLQHLNGEEYAFSPSFVNKKGDGIRWEDLPTVAAWTACSLAVIAGRTAGDAEGFADAVKAATDARPPLEKQQSRTQWGYIARTTFELLEAMSVDLEGLNRNLKQQFGFTCLRTLRDIDALNIRLA